MFGSRITFSAVDLGFKNQISNVHLMTSFSAENTCGRSRLAFWRIIHFISATTLYRSFTVAEWLYRSSLVLKCPDSKHSLCMGVSELGKVTGGAEKEWRPHLRYTVAWYKLAH